VRDLKLDDVLRAIVDMIGTSSRIVSVREVTDELNKYALTDDNRATEAQVTATLEDLATGPALKKQLERDNVTREWADHYGLRSG
jgi:hypothetical protein